MKFLNNRKALVSVSAALAGVLLGAALHGAEERRAGTPNTERRIPMR